MIPQFNQSGILPPFLLESGPTSFADTSPYKTSLVDFVSRFATSVERKKILQGFLAYRIALKKVGITSGFQWIDGSFTENIEKTAGRPPSDIDLVTFAHRPEKYRSLGDWKALVSANDDLFYPADSKSKYFCDAYFVDFDIPPMLIVKRTSYWFGLFSHKRESYMWKGMLEIDLSENEDEVLVHLLDGEHHAS